MDKVQVNKEELIAVLTKNRDQHKKDFEAAMGGYRLVAEAELKKRLKKVRSGQEFNLNFYKLHVPDSHVKEYQNVIDMLGVCSDVNISITMEDYLKYYKNEWSWCSSWQYSNSGYATLYNTPGVGVAAAAHYVSPSEEQE
jgi:hypothetical protein